MSAALPLLTDTELDELEASWEDATVRRLCDNVRRLRGQVVDRDLMLIRTLEVNRSLTQVLRSAGVRGKQLELVEQLLGVIEKELREKGLPT